MIYQRENFIQTFLQAEFVETDSITNHLRQTQTYTHFFRLTQISIGIGSWIFIQVFNKFSVLLNTQRFHITGIGNRWICSNKYAKFPVSGIKWALGGIFRIKNWFYFVTEDKLVGKTDQKSINEIR